MGQSWDYQCYSGVQGYSDREVVGYNVVYGLEQSQDYRRYSGVWGYSDRGVVEYTWKGSPWDNPGTISVTPVYRDTLTEE